MINQFEHDGVLIIHLSLFSVTVYVETCLMEGALETP